MRYNRNRALPLLLLVPLAVAGCAGNPILDPAEPAFAVANFGVNSTLIDNPYHPLVPGTVRIYHVDGEDGLETVVVEVLDITRLVSGIICTVVRDRVYIDELLIEDTHDWFAQDDSGNVWYRRSSTTSTTKRATSSQPTAAAPGRRASTVPCPAF